MIFLFLYIKNHQLNQYQNPSMPFLHPYKKRKVLEMNVTYTR
jgi:hypothetical protein